MIQLTLLSGQQAGVVQTARRLPFRIGRSDGDLRLAEPGVWEQHAEIRLGPSRKITLHARAEALVTVNGDRIQESPLRGGDIVEIGSVKLRFGFEPVRQRGLRGREALVWAGLAIVCLAQIAVVYWLLE